MICAKCGKEINDSAKFCPFCGTGNSLATTDVKTVPLAKVNKEPNLDEIMSGIDTLAIGDESEIVTVPFSVNDNNIFTSPVKNQNEINSENKEQPSTVLIAPVVNPMVSKSSVNNDNGKEKSKQFLIIAIVIIAVVALVSIVAISSVIFSDENTENVTEKNEEHTEESYENSYELSEEPTITPNITTGTTERYDDNGYHTVPSLRQEPVRGQDITPTYREETTQPNTSKPAPPQTTKPSTTRPTTTQPTTTRPYTTRPGLEIVSGEMDGSGWVDF